MGGVQGAVSMATSQCSRIIFTPVLKGLKGSEQSTEACGPEMETSVQCQAAPGPGGCGAGMTRRCCTEGPHLPQQAGTAQQSWAGPAPPGPPPSTLRLQRVPAALLSWSMKHTVLPNPALQATCPVSGSSSHTMSVIRSKRA